MSPRRRLSSLGHSLPRGSWQFSVPAESSLSRTWWTAFRSLLVSHKAKRTRWGSPEGWRILSIPVRISLQSPWEIISAAEERLFEGENGLNRGFLGEGSAGRQFIGVARSLFSTARQEISPQGSCCCPQHWETLQTTCTFTLQELLLSACSVSK